MLTLTPDYLIFLSATPMRNIPGDLIGRLNLSRKNEYRMLENEDAVDEEPALDFESAIYALRMFVGRERRPSR